MITEIKTNDLLIIGRYYHCFDKTNGTHSIHECRTDDGITNYISNNHIWASNDNNQALTKWRIFGPIEIPYINSIYLCRQHGGHGFISDCAVCNLNKKVENL